LLLKIFVVLLCGDFLAAQEGGVVAGPQRQTRQRAAIADLLSRTDQFRTASQIHDDLRHEGEDIGLTTVYRTLLMMANAGQLDLIRTGDGETAYRRCSMGHHHHLVCRDCGRTVEVEGPAIERWSDHVADQHGFSDVQHHLEIFGRCSSCADQTSAASRP
jgi:Fur family ferric uptake transcriptional regulator